MKLVPVMVTEVPPAVDPWAGLTPVTVGASADVASRSAATAVDVPAGDCEATGETEAETSGS